MRFMLLVGLLATTVMATPKLTPTQQLRLIEKEIGYSLSHIRVIKVELSDRLRGAACNPNLIVTNEGLWDTSGNNKNFVHLLHEVGHVLGLTHNNAVASVTYNGEPVKINNTVMATPSPESLRATVFRNHYIQEIKLRLMTKANAAYFWHNRSFPVQPLSQYECLKALRSPSGHDKLLIDWNK